MNATLTIPEPAYKTHDDAKEPGVMSRLEGCAELGPGILGLGELKRACKQEADNGCDPMKGGALELGLMLPEADYESLKGYAKSLTVTRPKVRRLARA